MNCPIYFSYFSKTADIRSAYWDWNKFNNERVTAFFQRTADSIQRWSGGPTTERCLRTTIKLQDGNEFKGRSGTGINRSALVALQSINGNDVSFFPVLNRHVREFVHLW